MKITKSQLQEIIKNELRLLSEQEEETKFLMPVNEFKWTKVPWKRDVLWVSPDQIKGNYMLPSREETVDQYISSLKKLYKRSPKTHLSRKEVTYVPLPTLKSLYDKIYGTYSRWTYGLGRIPGKQNAADSSFEYHPDLGFAMMPLAYSVTYAFAKTRADAVLSHIKKNKIQPNSDEMTKVAKVEGFSNVAELRRCIELLNKY